MGENGEGPQPANKPRRNFLKAAAGLGLTAAVRTIIPPTTALGELGPHTESPITDQISPEKTLPENVDKTPSKLRTHLTEILQHPPKVGGFANHGKELHEGLGWATFECYQLPDKDPKHDYSALQIFAQTLNNRGVMARANLARYSDKLSDTIKNRLHRIIDITLDPKDQNRSNLNKVFQETTELANTVIVDDQSNLSPEEALQSEKYIGFVATRGKDDIGKKLLIYTLDKPDDAPKFQGVVLVFDNSGHLDNMFKPYGYGGWDTKGFNNGSLEWMLDVSYSVMKHLPLGESPSRDDPDHGRPGIIAISEDCYHEIVNDASSRNLPTKTAQ